MRRTKQAAREELENVIRAYCFINANLEYIGINDHPDAEMAKVIAQGTLNQLLNRYRDKNGNQAFEDFCKRLGSEYNQSGDGDQSGPAPISDTGT
jgi:hypothetical protein